MLIRALYMHMLYSLYKQAALIKELTSKFEFQLDEFRVYRLII